MTNNGKIFLICNNDVFSKHINMCLKEDSLEIDIGEILPEYEPEIAIINLFFLSENIEKQLYKVLKSKVKKIILIENGLDLYLNSKNTIPFSVYTKLIPKNEICERLLDLENKVIESKKQYAIFRVSEIYGISTHNEIIERLLFGTINELENSVRDFIYDGDVISAIEIALRKEVSGVFDIASGESIELKKLVELIKKLSKNNLNINWKRKKVTIEFNCDNFKYYKWQPIVGLEIGLKTLLAFRRSNGSLQRTRKII